MVKQFTINLNKGEGEIVLRQRRQERRSFLVLGLLAVVFMVLGGLTWAQNEAMNDVITFREKKLERIKFELDSLKREGTNVSKEDVMSLTSLEQERFLWARRLEMLSNLIPPGMAISGLEFQNRTFVIEAISKIDSSQKEFDVISKFIEVLKSTPEFRHGMFEIKFDKSIRKMQEEQDVLMFSVECTTSDPTKKKAPTTRRSTTPIPGT